MAATARADRLRGAAERTCRDRHVAASQNANKPDACVVGAEVPGGLPQETSADKAANCSASGQDIMAAILHIKTSPRVITPFVAP